MDIIVAKHVILQHQQKVITSNDEENKQILFVRRREIIKEHFQRLILMFRIC